VKAARILAGNADTVGTRQLQLTPHPGRTRRSRVSVAPGKSAGSKLRWFSPRQKIYRRSGNRERAKLGKNLS
jgi:hypothetical protein